MIVYPDIDPVAIAIGPVKVHWYGLMYVLGFIAGWWLARRRAALPGSTWKPADVDDLIFFAAVGVIAGGRLGWMLFYGLDNLRADPLAFIRVWEGGMSFHGGLIGVMLAVAWFARRRGRRVADVFDFTAPLPAVGLCAGRIGNFINGELWGRPTELPWGMLVDGRVLHPSQLYEAALEGVVLFAVIWWFTVAAAAAARAVGPVPHALCRIPHGRGVRARAGCRHRIPCIRVADDGPGPVAARAGGGALDARLRVHSARALRKLRLT